jgi:ATPase subunit of ABC transporter with duplicated ATPase domains
VVLDDVSVTLPAGAVVAIVGENGAGKTTLVKLLAKMSQYLQEGIGCHTSDNVGMHARRQLLNSGQRCWNSGCIGDRPAIRLAASVALGTSHGPRPSLFGLSNAYFRSLGLPSSFEEC